MKSITKSISFLILGLSPALFAQVSKTTETTETTRSANGAVSETTTTTVETFNPDARTKVVTYFDPYKANRHGLPPAYARKVRAKEIPVAWKTTRISPGATVTESQRPYLVAAPEDLVKVLPAPRAGVRYYIAGSNVVAVDPSYKIIDSVQIPTIKYSEDDDDVEIESREGRTSTKVEIDKDDGEVEVEKERDD